MFYISYHFLCQTNKTVFHFVWSLITLTHRWMREIQNFQIHIFFSLILSWIGICLYYEQNIYPKNVLSYVLPNFSSNLKFWSKRKIPVWWEGQRIVYKDKKFTYPKVFLHLLSSGIISKLQDSSSKEKTGLLQYAFFFLKNIIYRHLTSTIIRA